MSRGQADFGMYTPQTVIGSLADMGELAARLGSIVTYDRRGYVVDLDDFEEPVLKWLVAGYGSAIFSNLPKVGSQSCLITTGDEIGEYESITRRIQLLGADRIGVELSFRGLSVTAYLAISVQVIKADGSYKYANMKVKSNDNTVVSIYTPDEYVVIATEAKRSLNTYYTIKLVFDVSTGKYVRLLYAGTEYDISAYDLYADEVAIGNATITVIQVYPETDAVAFVHADAYILTINEP